MICVCVAVGLVRGGGSPPPGPWLCMLSPAGWLPRVRDQLRPLTLDYEYGKPLPLCLSDDNFWQLWCRKFVFAHPISPRDTVEVRIWRSLGQCQDHWSKKGLKCLFMHWSTSVGNFHPYSPDGATRGWSCLRLEGMLVARGKQEVFCETVSLLCVCVCRDLAARNCL